MARTFIADWLMPTPQVRVALVIMPPAQTYRFKVALRLGQDDSIEILQAVRDLCFPAREK